MPKKNSKNNDLLNEAKKTTSNKIYPLLVSLVNDDREDLAEVVLKIDYLLEYASTAIKGKYYKDAKEALETANKRLELLKKESVDTDYLEYLYEGIVKKVK